jgi:hypothetical protein
MAEIVEAGKLKRIEWATGYGRDHPTWSPRDVRKFKLHIPMPGPLGKPGMVCRASIKFGIANGVSQRHTRTQ